MATNLSRYFNLQQRAFIILSSRYMTLANIAKVLKKDKDKIQEYIDSIGGVAALPDIRQRLTTSNRLSAAISGKKRKSRGRKGWKRSNSGMRKDLGVSVKSNMEANVARCFSIMGYKWEYECKRFGFISKKYKRVNSYLPDFKVTDSQGNTVYWVEVKGKLNAGDQGRLRLMKEEFPDAFAKLLFITKKYNKKELAFAKQIGIPFVWHYEDMKSQYEDDIKNCKELGEWE